MRCYYDSHLTPLECHKKIISFSDEWKVIMNNFNDIMVINNHKAIMVSGVGETNGRKLATFLPLGQLL